GVAVDISRRVAAETELLQSRNYAQAVTECMGEGLFTLDVNGRITYMNRAAEELLGAAEGELRGREVGTAVLAPRDGERRRFAESPMSRALAREVPVRVSQDTFATPAGELPVSYTATPFQTSDGIQGCVVIFQDASERRAREEEGLRNAATL